jgi:amino acid adenylation domain-containing protein
MKTLDALLFELSQKDVQLWLDGDRLRYRAAKDAVTSELLAEIKEYKPEIIKFLQQVTQDQNSEILPIVKIDRDGFLPLSFAQQRLWYLQQFEPDSSSNNMPIVVKFTGSLKVDMLRKSFQSLVQRHEVLRTKFPFVNGQAALVIEPDVDVDLPVIDLRHLAAEERSSESMRIATLEARVAFDLANGSMLRLLLLHMSDDEYLLAWNMHCIICDGASSDVIFRDLIAFYTAFSSGNPPVLPDLPVQYVDFAHWQRQWLQGEILESQTNYWKQKLTGSISTIKLPTDHPRPPKVQTYNGERGGRLLSKALNADLINLGRKLGGTLFMILIATFEILLHRYSQQNDILITFASAGRSDTEMEGLVGFFSNTLIQRIDFDGNPTFRELFSRVREASLEANSHQDLPFEKLIEELPSELSYSRSPLFQTKFALNPPWTNGRGQAAVKLPDLTITSLWGHTYHGKTKHDLMLVMREHEAGLGMVFDYNADIFEASTITRMLGHFETLLQGIVANPDQKISEMQLLTDLELSQILHDWHTDDIPIPEACIHQLFEAQVEQSPDAIAIISTDEQLTYRELNNRANQLAHYLQSQGVGPETLVAICLEKSVQLLIGILGILKAGGTYIPLNPSYSHERRISKLRNAQVPLALTVSNMSSTLADCGAQVVSLDAEWEAIAAHSIDNPSSPMTAENLAYVIYTSGSTGEPKGVTISHRSMVNHSLAISKIFELNSQDRVLHFSNISFDVAVEEIFPTWLNGATLVLPTENLYNSITYFLEEVLQRDITVLNLPTVFWHELVHGISTLNKPIPVELRLVIVGGEKVSRSTYQKWRSLVGDFPRWLNAYGPTEATVTATIYDPLQSAEALHPDAEVPIGRAIANLQTYVLDRNLQPSPIGVAGELYIGGVGLSRGYLNRPDITATRFIPNPFSKNSEDRLYKTGDLARYLPDGNLEFIGRSDFQIKIGGFRVEPIEIETQLEKYPAVKQAIVLCHEILNGEKLLVAYLSADRDQMIDIDSLGEFLRQKTPAYMLPSRFIVLDALPLTPNGKVDRRALLELDAAKQQAEKVIAPRDELEQKLANIWEKLLGRKSIGIHDNFFELGGNSLLSIRLISEIEQTFNWHLPLSSFFQINSIAEIAQKIRQTPTETVPTEDLTLGLSLEDYRALLAQSIGKVGLRVGKRGLIINILPESQVSSNPFVWIGEVKTGERLNLKQPVYVMPGASLSPSMNCHEDYISVIASLLVDELISAQPSGPYSLGGWCYNGLVAMEMAQQLKKLGQEVELLTLIDVSGGSKIYVFMKDAEFYLGTLRFHLFNLAKLSFKEKTQYFTSRTMKVIKRITGKMSILKSFKDEASDLNEPQETNLKKAVDIAVDFLEKPSRAYVRKPYDGKVLLVDGSEQIIFMQKEIKRFNLFWLFPYNGFRDLLQGKVYISKIKCDHLELMQEPYCSQIGELIQRV